MPKLPPPEETKWKPGESGNPAGKPKGTISWKTTFKKWLEAETDEENPISKAIEKMTQLDKITLMQIKKARNGDTRAAEFLKDHMEAKPKQGIDLTSAGEKIGEKEIRFIRYKKDEKK